MGRLFWALAGMSVFHCASGFFSSPEKMSFRGGGEISRCAGDSTGVDVTYSEAFRMCESLYHDLGMGASGDAPTMNYVMAFLFAGLALWRAVARGRNDGFNDKDSK